MPAPSYAGTVTGASVSMPVTAGTNAPASAAPTVPTLAAPAPITPPVRPAPLYEPKPAIKPLLRLPVARVVAPPMPAPIVVALLIPVIISGAAAPPVKYMAAAPAIIGSNDDKKPASAKPVSGLIVSVPPCAIASFCRPWTSPLVMWTSSVSGPLPREASPCAVCLCCIATS